MLTRRARILIAVAVGAASIAGVACRQPAPPPARFAAYLLFNVFQPRVEVGSDPFEPCSRMPSRCSANNQVILVPQTVPSGCDALF